MKVKDSYCGFCGAPFPALLTSRTVYPRVCRGDGTRSGCGQITYNSPSVVSLVVAPVVDAVGRVGVLATRHAAKTGLEKYSLPGSYVEGPACRDHAAKRSAQLQGIAAVFEATGLRIPLTGLTELFVVGPTESNTLLIFFEANPLKLKELSGCSATEELSEWMVLFEAQELAFLTHTEVLKWYLRGKREPIWQFSPTINRYRESQRPSEYTGPYLVSRN